MMNKDVAVGINIGGISYYSSEVKWVDIANQSKYWLTQRDGVPQWDTHEIDKVPLRDDGYPARLDGNSSTPVFAEVGWFGLIRAGLGRVE